MLRTGLEPEGVTKTKIMYEAYLSFNQLKDYLDLVLDNGSIEKTATNKYRTTAKGVQMLENFRQINVLVGVQRD